MAISLQTLRGQKKTSIHGRRLALDSDDNLVGVTGYREATFELTSASTAQTLSKFGLTVINVSSLATSATNRFTIPNPTPGLRVTYASGARGSTSGAGSTAIALQRASTAFYIQSSNGSTGIGVLLAAGNAITLEGVSTNLYMAVGGLGLPTVIATS